jgi:hypothetical protein
MRFDISAMSVFDSDRRPDRVVGHFCRGEI